MLATSKDAMKEKKRGLKMRVEAKVKAWCLYIHGKRLSLSLSFSLSKCVG